MISLEKIALENKTIIVFLVNRVFGQKFTRNAKNFCYQVQLLQFLSLNLCDFDPGLHSVPNGMKSQTWSDY